MVDMRIVSRAKPVDGLVQAPRIVILNASNLKRYYSLPLSLAAKDLGVCPTALKWYRKCQFARFLLCNLAFARCEKKVHLTDWPVIMCSSACRKIGIKSWPYRKVCYKLSVM